MNIEQELDALFEQYKGDLPWEDELTEDEKMLADWATDGGPEPDLGEYKYLVRDAYDEMQRNAPLPQ